MGPGRVTRDWDAATYDQISHPQTRRGKAVVDRLALNGDELDAHYPRWRGKQRCGSPKASWITSG